jgi:hypothetical protein
MIKPLDTEHHHLCLCVQSRFLTPNLFSLQLFCHIMIFGVYTALLGKEAVDSDFFNTT